MSGMPAGMRITPDMARQQAAQLRAMTPQQRDELAAAAERGDVPVTGFAAPSGSRGARGDATATDRMAAAAEMLKVSQDLESFH